MNQYIGVLKKYAVFGGRATRTEFWMFTLWNVVISVVLMMIFGAIANAAHAPSAIIVYWLYVLAVFLPALGVSIRRLHDTGRNGWWILIDLVPLIGAIVLIVFFVQDSVPDNQYGPNPKGPTAAPPAPTSPSAA